jgi:predicted GIY-YIG superfamily endonuclease
VFYVYILRLANKRLYVGFTTNLKQRIIEHNSGKSPYTAKFKPVKLVYYSAFETREKALEFEKYLKSGSGIAFRTKRLV